MDAINALHDQVCTIEKDLQKWQEEKEKKSKRLEELLTFKEQNIKRVSKLEESIKIAKDDLEVSHGHVQELQAENSQFTTKIEEQDRLLATLPKLIHKYTIDFENYSAQYRQAIKILYEDMSRAKGYSQKLHDLNSKMSQNQATWKLREQQRESYRAMMMRKAKEDVSKETKELSSLLTQLQSLKRLHPALPYSVPTHPSHPPPVDRNMSMGGKRPSPNTHYPQKAIEPANHQQLQHIPQQPGNPPSNNNNDLPDEDIIELDTDNYRSSSVASPLTINTPSSGGFPGSSGLHNASTITATRATVVSENSTIQIESYEMSVSPWFQDRKRRKIDVYSLQDNFQG